MKYKFLVFEFKNIINQNKKGTKNIKSEFTNTKAGVLTVHYIFKGVYQGQQGSGQFCR